MPIDSRRAWAATGIITLSSSSEPAAPAKATVASLPTTWAATMVSDSAMTGLIFPGMIEDPGWTSGRAISAIPARGPHASNRMSAAIS